MLSASNDEPNATPSHENRCQYTVVLGKGRPISGTARLCPSVYEALLGLAIL